MTVSSWDSQELVRQFSGCKNLREVIAKLEEDFTQKGEVICEIRVNGMLLDEEDEAKFAESQVAEIQDLSVRSNRPADLIAEALKSAFDFAPQLEENCLKTADLMRGSDLEKSRQGFHETLEACQWLIDTLVHVRGAASGIGAPLERAETWFSAVQTTMRAIKEMSDAFESGDQTLVADLLEYELTGALAIWKEALAVEIAKRG